MVSQISATETLGTSIDCSTVVINFTDNPEWSKQERVKAMDKAFFDSIDRFELCNLSNKSGDSAAAGGSMAQNGNGNSTGAANSSESSAMKGTEAKKKGEGDEQGENSNSESESGNANKSEQTTGRPSDKKGGQGNTNITSTPKDIPSSNNDDVIAAQIRLAAEIEKDPVKKNKLWNEYRKYKGMAVQ